METREVHISEDAEALFRCLADNKGTSCGTDEQTAINELTAGLNFQKCILVPKVELHDNRWVLLADEMEVLQTFKDSNVYDKNEYQNFAPLNSLRGWEPRIYIDISGIVDLPFWRKRFLFDTKTSRARTAVLYRGFNMQWLMRWQFDLRDSPFFNENLTKKETFSRLIDEKPVMPEENILTTRFVPPPTLGKATYPDVGDDGVDEEDVFYDSETDVPIDLTVDEDVFHDAQETMQDKDSVPASRPSDLRKRSAFFRKRSYPPARKTKNRGRISPPTKAKLLEISRKVAPKTPVKTLSKSKPMTPQPATPQPARPPPATPQPATPQPPKPLTLQRTIQQTIPQPTSQLKQVATAPTRTPPVIPVTATTSTANTPSTAATSTPNTSTSFLKSFPTLISNGATEKRRLFSSYLPAAMVKIPSISRPRSVARKSRKKSHVKKGTKANKRKKSSKRKSRQKK